MKVSKGRAILEPLPGSGVWAPSVPCLRRGEPESLAAASDSKPRLFCLIFFSPFPYTQPSQAAGEGVIKNQVC